MTRLHRLALLLVLCAACKSETPTAGGRWTPELAARLKLLAGGDCLATKETFCEGPNGSFKAARHPGDELSDVSFEFTTQDLASAKATIAETLAPLKLSSAAMEGLAVRLKVPGYAKMSTPTEHIDTMALTRMKEGGFTVRVNVWWYH